MVRPNSLLTSSWAVCFLNTGQVLRKAPRRKYWNKAQGRCKLKSLLIGITMRLDDADAGLQAGVLGTVDGAD